MPSAATVRDEEFPYHPKPLSKSKRPLSGYQQRMRAFERSARKRDRARSAAARGKAVERMRGGVPECPSDLVFYGTTWHDRLEDPKTYGSQECPWGPTEARRKIFRWDFDLHANGATHADLDRLARINGADYVTQTRHWMRRIMPDHPFEMVCLGEEDDPIANWNGDHDSVAYGYLSFDGVERRGWYVVFQMYVNGRIHIQPPAGASDSDKYMAYSRDTACFPTVATAVPRLVGDGPMGDIYSEAAGKIPSHMEATLALSQQSLIYECHPDVRYLHPETNEPMDWLEWTRLQRRKFNLRVDSQGLKDWRDLPSFIRTRIDMEAEDDEAESVIDDPAGQQLFRRDVDKWSKPDIQTVDGFPMFWEYCGTNGLDPEDIVNLLMEHHPARADGSDLPRAWQDDEWSEC